VTVEGDLHCTGNISYGTLSSPFWVAGKVNGYTMEILASAGRYTFVAERVSGHSEGVYRIRWTPSHPNGEHYVIQVSIQLTGYAKIWDNSSNLPDSTSFCVVTGTEWATDATWYFNVMV
jgi:hypothetical protein